MNSNNLIDSNYNSSGIYRAIVYYDGSKLRVFVPGLSTFGSIPNKNVWLTGLFESQALKEITAINQELSAWVIFENGNMKRPIVMGYFGDSIPSGGVPILNESTEDNKPSTEDNKPSTEDNKPSTEDNNKFNGSSSLYWPVATNATGYNTLSSHHGSGHTGIDIACSTSSNVLAITNGTVTYKQVYTVIDNVKYLVSYGNYIYFTGKDESGNSITAIYAHLDTFAKGITNGIPSNQTKKLSVSQCSSTNTIEYTVYDVVAGEVIGTSGSTGNSSGPHLHFELSVGGSKVNPLNYIDKPK